MPHERFRELGEQFLRRTREDWVAMQAAFVKAQSGDAAALSELRILAHRICGSGAMLAFMKISERSGEIENIIRSATALAAIDWPAIARLLQELDMEINRAASL